jgi:hypothetical protein
MLPSIQRTISVCGPRLIRRDLEDGQTFTDCNYWKRFAYPQLPLDQAFITVISDDGSVYSDDIQENTFGVVLNDNTSGSTFHSPVLSSDTFSTNYFDIAGTYSGFAKFVQMQNFAPSTSTNYDIKVQLSGSTNAVMILKATDTQIFNANDLAVTKLAFQGGVSNVSVQIIMSVMITPTS